MGKPNTALFSHDTLFTALLGADGGVPLTQFALLAVLLLIVRGALYRFLLTELGLGLRAVGSNQMMARAGSPPGPSSSPGWGSRAALRPSAERRCRNAKAMPM
ncbi:MAG: hypothetical protein F4103_05245 [Boseongicola sp. SB0673_bin_14]|nr:hypothetical protein [Boseongicola sp. SB0667_bin_21]MYI68167.1 hypothetical protein [Boseongicola sp. SB0673_bin_14]